MRSTRDSRGRERRVVAKAEWTHGKANPRFVIASLAAREYDARSLDEELYRQRGEMENRIEECQLDPFADGASAHGMRANRTPPAVRVDGLCAALRLAPPSLAHTRLAVATCGSLRLEPLKIAAWMQRIGVRLLEIAMDTDHSFQDVFRTAQRRLSAAAA